MHQNCDFGFISWFQHNYFLLLFFFFSIQISLVLGYGAMKKGISWVMWLNLDEHTFPGKEESPFFFFPGSISPKHRSQQGLLEEKLGNSTRPLQSGVDPRALCSVCSYFLPRIFEYCCQSRTSSCLPHSRHWWKKTTGDFKRNQILSLASCKPSHHTTWADFVFLIWRKCYKKPGFAEWKTCNKFYFFN